MVPSTRRFVCGSAGCFAAILALAAGTTATASSLSGVGADDPRVPVGGGVTLRSDPQAEYEETLAKAQQFFRLLGLKVPQGS